MMYRRAHTRIMFRCWILHLPLCLLWQPQYPCFCTFPLLGFGLFHFTSEKERGCYTPAGGTFVMGYSQIAGGMSYQLMPGGPLMPGFTLRLHDLCTFRKGPDEPRTILCNRSKRGLTGLHDSPCPASVSAFS